MTAPERSGETAPPQAPAGTTADGSRNPFESSRFRRWWLASMVAGTGIGIQSVTVPLYIRDRVAFDDRAVAISGALIASTLPGAFLALFGGTAADRIEQRRILARTYVVGALVSAFYVLLCVADARIVWPVYPLAALVGAAGAFTNPARQSMLPQLVGGDALQNGVIFGTMGFMATLQFLGPSVAGLVTEGFGLAAAFSLEVGLLLLGALAFSGIRTQPPPRSGRNVLGDLTDGLRYVADQPALRDVLLLAAIPGIFFIGPFAVTVPILVPDLFQASDKWVGLLWGAFGGGVFTGSILLTLRPIPRRGLAVCASTLAGGLLLILYSQSESLHVSAGLLYCWGIGASVFINYAVALLQHHSAPHMIGRVMSMYTLIFFTASPLGYLQAGLITDAYGPQTTLLASGCVAALVGGSAVLFLRSVRALD
ncbi:MAG: MFS transporter [Myxococcales bacterium]|nr:MFS transporter [Myxococcales bacterium]